ncbi:thymidylate kinase [Micromonospora qiuiae]|uniref:Thymidylate kinase n=1 Tax=Micromonospora qiuiae TaxID=502268 RepID=A0ABQ4JJ72_9ACTN|nr:dTMP kinase [Micromonospora qiuiae]GIJ30647.1 thymidylate kinase [Micromonospora qiuiae]
MLIAFEGLPGAGKTTQSRALATHLSQHCAAVTYLPDNLTRDAEPLGQALLTLFDSGDPFSRHDSVLTDTYLAAAIRADTYATHIARMLAAGATVVEDRGLHTLYSYSLAGLLQKHRAPPDEAIAWLQQVGAFAGPAADRSLWLRLPPDDAIARAEQRQGHPYTDEQRAFLRYVHDAYTALAETDPDLHVIDVSGLGIDDAHQAVLAAVADLTAPAVGLSNIS